MRKLFLSVISLCVLALSTYAANWNDVAGVTPIEKPRPAGVSNGIYYGEDGTSVTLCTYAASKTESAKRVFLLGDMTNWKLSADYQLYKDGNYFWITLTGLESRRSDKQEAGRNVRRPGAASGHSARSH